MNYDLLAFAKRLHAEDRERKLAKALEQYSRLSGIVFDLEAAQTAICSFTEFWRSREAMNAAGLGHLVNGGMHGAFYVSFMLYIRSTSGTGDPAPLHIGDAYTAAQKSKHVAIYDLRNEALAHRGAGSHSTGDFMYDALVCNEGFIAMPTGRRSLWRESIYRDLIDLIPCALDLAQSQKTKQKDLVDSKLRPLLVADPEALAWLREVEYDEGKDSGSSLRLNLAGIGEWIEPAH